MNIIYTCTGGLIARHWQANLVVALDCHCNQLPGRAENMDDHCQDMMQYFEYVHVHIADRNCLAYSDIGFKLTIDG